MLASRQPLRDAIERCDETVERWVDRHRGHPILDRVMYVASDLGDHSLVWHLVGVGRALGPDRRGVHAIRLSVMLGVESVLVNVIVKSAFRRHRPAWEQDRPHPLRRPLTSSFPSGHASSAFTAAGVLCENDPLCPLYYAIAAVVASSRVYVKIHHPSDVIAGAVLGAVLARLARRAWPVPVGP